ncbi:MAG: rod shape-determining protein [Clostridia bacterium]|nr:rod shape-determining protein [Clostridia bacterium]
MAKQIGIDLGTANTVICLKGSGIVLRVPSVIAIRESDHEVIAFGHEARQMLGKTPPSVRVERPLRNGVITDADIATRMLHAFYKKIEATTLFSRPEVFICTPCGITGVERSAVEMVASEAGARRVELIEEPLASAIGAGIRIERSRGSMIVDIGGGTTEVAVLSYRGIVAAKTIRVAGDAVDSAIMRYMRYRRGVMIGETAAEAIKIRVGSVYPAITAKTPYEAFGRSVRTNMAAAVMVGSQELCPYLQAPVREIISAIMTTLEETPPELASDIYENGIMLTGGSSQLAGLAQLIREVTGLKIIRANRPLDTVCIGLSRILESEGDSSPVREQAFSGTPGFGARMLGGMRLPFTKGREEQHGPSASAPHGNGQTVGGRRK